MLGLCVCAVVKIEPATQDQHSNRIALSYDDGKMLPAVRIVYHTDETIACAPPPSTPTRHIGTADWADQAASQTSDASALSSDGRSKRTTWT